MPKDYAALPYAEVRRRDRAVADEEWIRDLLRRAPIGSLATISDGQPFLNQNLFVFDEAARAIYMHTAQVGRTRANVERDERVCFAVSEMGRLLPADTALEFSVEYSGAVVFGRAALVDDADEAERALQMLLDKYFAHLAAGRDYRPIVAEELARTAVYRIDIESWSGKKKEVEAGFLGAFRYPPRPAFDMVTLEGQHVRLEPLTHAHAPGLAAVSADEEIWRYFSVALMTEDDVRRWIDVALGEQAAGVSQPFAIIHRATGRAIGSTRYMNIARRDRGLEIGSTWLGRAYWRTAVNTECKFLLLRHAFETLGCIRVQIKTDARNERSRRAIERLGAQFEGILRRHMIVRDGVYRDTAMYSIIDTGWPEVKARLGAVMSSEL